MSDTFFCLYCAADKPNNEASLEHAVPQFMGGDSSPKQFHLKNVCRTCNNLLGLFVDAAYAKSWFVTNTLSEAARGLCTAASDPGLPLTCMGPTILPDLAVGAHQIAEYWIGPSGESVVWVRAHDERMESYSGGNPIDAKKKESVAYFVPTSGDPVRFELGNRSFHRAFDKRKIRKILCAEIRDENEAAIDPSLFGFDTPTEDDKNNRVAILAAIRSGSIRAKISVNTKFDLRFICKLALAIAYSLFGDEYLNSEASLELRKGLWPKQGGAIPDIKGKPTLPFGDPRFASLVGYPGAAAIMLMKIDNHWILTASIDEKLPFSISIGPDSMVSNHVNSDEGYTLLLFPYLNKAIELTTASLLAHRLGNLKNKALEQIDDRMMDARAFIDKLVPMLMQEGG